MAASPSPAPSLERYRQKRHFDRTPEPGPAAPRAGRRPPIFVVQKHDARRLHWDFRLEHGGVLWSWAVPKGPSLDPADKRLAVRTEDHPLAYAEFAGTIPEGQYGAGTVERWDYGRWDGPADPAAALARGELKFTLEGRRLRGRFVLVRMAPRGREKGENWLLIKERDDFVQPGADAARLEAAIEAPPAPGRARGGKPVASRGQAGRASGTASAETREASRKAASRAAEKGSSRGSGATPARIAAQATAPGRPAAPGTKGRAAPARPDTPPAPGARRAGLPKEARPQLASLATELPEEPGWLSEVKFDGYRILLRLQGGKARLITRGAQDWTHRLPELAKAAEALGPRDALLDGELVALRRDGLSSFGDLQKALSEGRTGGLHLYLFDLLHWEGWDLRRAPLVARKAALQRLVGFDDRLRYSDHVEGQAEAMRARACAMGLEGIISKRADAPYAAGRSTAWRKLKCGGREELVILGWTPPAGSRQHFGALHLGYYDLDGALHYAGGVGTGFDAGTLRDLRRRLDRLAAGRPALRHAGDPPERAIHWVRPELVAEIRFIGWTAAGRVRQAVFLGLREDKRAGQVRRAVVEAEGKEHRLPATRGGARAAPEDPPEPPPTKPARASPARAAGKGKGDPAAPRLTHPERELWPGITKQDLADYWRAVAEHALPGIAQRPLALLRCPEGIDGESFFQKHAMRGNPPALRAGESQGDPYLAVDGLDGLLACAQLAAIELHGWGAPESEPDQPDRLVLDLDPGEGVVFDDVVQAARDIRDALRGIGLESFCRTSGGKGLHLVAPLAPGADWDSLRDFARGIAETLSAAAPRRFVATVSKAKRRGRILIDWLRNGRGATAVASFSPRARPGAPVATPLAWREVKPGLDPLAFTLETVPKRLARQRRDPWEGWHDLRQRLPAPPDAAPKTKRSR
ncbi:DNA ligase D [Pseudoroseomonas cervicalis]|uniref:DNA ligase D n=1 Tax=Teichococcus cervicalis TaxID=204525 RepID=UPI002783C3DA|nr:DNA ligase D [Pseudoroseomonas cervicalis]MDQ1078796.1 bifunctional non-homologous end joining protein LigD [Pseudoroseomonas cervicalis]